MSITKQLPALSIRKLWHTGVTPPPPSPVGTTVVDIQNLAVTLGGKQILYNVNLQVRTGEVLALVGPNGAGKSTLLAALSADLPLAGGQITIFEQSIGDYSARALALRRAVLLQQSNLSFPFQVIEVVEMGRAPWQQVATATDDNQIVQDALATTQMTNFAGRIFGTLSGGEKARASLARVLAQQAPIMLLDEPTAALDINHQEQVMQIARNQARAGAAVVIVLHDLGVAAAYADRVALLSEGELRAYGAATEVFTTELLSEVYQHDIEVFAHPRTGEILILPIRDYSKT